MKVILVAMAIVCCGCSWRNENAVVFYQLLDPDHPMTVRLINESPIKGVWLVENCRGTQSYVKLTDMQPTLGNCREVGP